jgi:hypothetical protein
LAAPGVLVRAGLQRVVALRQLAFSRIQAIRKASKGVHLRRYLAWIPLTNIFVGIEVIQRVKGSSKHLISPGNVTAFRRQF